MSQLGPRSVVGVIAAFAVVAPLWWSSEASVSSAAPASARAESWGPIADVSPPGMRVGEVAVATTPRGTATAVWDTDAGRIWAALRPAGSTWRAPVAIGAGWSPQIGLDARGNATVVWMGARRVWTAGRPAGGHWSDPEPISRRSPIGDPEAYFDLEVAANGAAVVTWEWGDYDYGPWSLEAVYRPAHAVWQRARTLQSTHGEVYFEPDAAIDPSGRAVVTYIREDAYSNIRPVYVRRHLDGARWTRRTAISSPRSNRSARAVVDRGGTITIVWQREGQTPGIEAARHRLGHPWTHPVRLDSGVSGDLQSVVDAAGSVTCVWTRWDASVHAARRPARGPWNKVRQIAPPASQTSVYTRVSLAVGIEGDLAVLWRHRGSRAVFRPRRGGWGQPLLVPLGTDTRPGSRLGPIGAIAGNGDTLIVWIAHGHLRARWHRAS